MSTNCSNNNNKQVFVQTSTKGAFKNVLNKIVNRDVRDNYSQSWIIRNTLAFVFPTPRSTNLRCVCRVAANSPILTVEII